VADVLQVLEALCEAGAAGDPSLGPAFDWLVAQQDADGRWANRYAYQGKMVRDIDRPGRPSKWVTLRACRVLKARAEAQERPVPGASDRPGDLGFTFQVRKSGDVVISRDGRAVTTLRGSAATGFLDEVAGADSQGAMARLTGNYRRGNERLASRHPRNRG
jgi:hypothetical protein